MGLIKTINKRIRLQDTRTLKTFIGEIKGSLPVTFRKVKPVTTAGLLKKHKLPKIF